MDWIAYCTVCGEISRGPNGSWMEAEARVHRRDTGHMTIVGYEPSIVMGGKMTEVPIEKKGFEKLFELEKGDRVKLTMPASEPFPAGWAEGEVSSAHFYEDHGWYVELMKDKVSPGWDTGYGYWKQDADGGWIEKLTGTEYNRPLPQTYGDWVDLAEDIKDKLGDNVEARMEVNKQLGYIAADVDNSETAKRWLVDKAGELGIT